MEAPNIELPQGCMFIKATNPEEQGPCVIINKEDFNAETMEEYIPPRVSSGDGDAPKKKKAGT